MTTSRVANTLAILSAAAVLLPVAAPAVQHTFTACGVIGSQIAA
jgi:hypothetical protein